MTRNKIFLMMLIVVLAVCLLSLHTVYAEEETSQTVTSSVAETVVSSISGTSEDIALQIEMWQEYIDKYIMPNALAVLTSISMVFAVFSKFKSIIALYKEDKDAFTAEKDEIFSQLKSEVSGIIETLSDVKQTTLETIDNMPIATIQEDIAKAKDALEAEMSSIQDFTRMFEIFLASERKLVDTSTLSLEDKKQMKKLFYEGETLAKKKQASLADVSDFVLATITGGQESESGDGEDGEECDAANLEIQAASEESEKSESDSGEAVTA